MKQILEKKKELERQRIEKNRLEGRVEQLYSTLRSKYDCTSIDEAKQKLQRAQKSMDRQSKKIDILIKEWEEAFLKDVERC